MQFNYKKLIGNQKLRFRILQMLSFLDDKSMLSLQYRIKLGRKLNWEDPKRFTEILQRYKADYRNPVLHKCVDKLAVREFVVSKGLEHILNKLYGSYENAEEIDFSKLPDQFVLKTTNGGGGENIIICKDKSQLDIADVRKKLDSWLRLKTIDFGREWAYTGIEKPMIIAEELLINPSAPDEGIEDYKILCFNGSPKIVILDTDRYIGHKRNFYDTNWNRIMVSSDCPGKDDKIEQPKNLTQMLKIAATLSSEFPFVRVDLYNIDGQIYFGELTFYPWSGYVQFTPDEFDFELGNLMDISQFKRTDD